jgi:hypothetical protein
MTLTAKTLMLRSNKVTNPPTACEPKSHVSAGRVFGYARVSTSEQSNNGQSLATPSNASLRAGHSCKTSG